MKVALYGGSFDPIHQGHLGVAKAIKPFVDEVWFIPTYANALNKPLYANFKQREKMIALAIKPFKKFKLCSIEETLKKTSYTIDCVNALQKKYPSFHFVWLMGMDQCANFTKWKDNQVLAKLLEFVVYPRGLKTKIPTFMKMLDNEQINVSSSEIRSGNKWCYLTKSTRNYMVSNGIYFETIVAHHLSEKRYQHVISVAQLSEQLAYANGLNPVIAYQSGLLHDIAKEMSDEYTQKVMSIMFKDLLGKPQKILHAFVGMYYVQKKLGITNPNIKTAIFHHVNGNSQNQYAKIVFIADKLDPLRNDGNVKILKENKYNIDVLYKIVKETQIKYLKQEGYDEEKN